MTLSKSFKMRSRSWNSNSSPFREALGELLEVVEDLLADVKTDVVVPVVDTLSEIGVNADIKDVQ